MPGRSGGARRPDLSKGEPGTLTGHFLLCRQFTKFLKSGLQVKLQKESNKATKWAPKCFTAFPVSSLDSRSPNSQERGQLVTPSNGRPQACVHLGGLDARLSAAHAVSCGWGAEGSPARAAWLPGQQGSGQAVSPNPSDPCGCRKSNPG